MRYRLKKLSLRTALVGTVVAGSTAVSAVELAGGSVSANLGVVSNYYFRGVTQTDDGAAIQGGLDWAHEAGFYLGTWASNIDFGSDQKASAEVDLYGGYDFKLGDFDLGVNTIYYWYPDAGRAGNAQGKGFTELDYWEIGGSVGWQWLKAGLQYTVWGEPEDGAFQDGDVYLYASADYEIAESWGVGAEIGRYEFDDDDNANNYTHWGASISKSAGDFGTFSFNYVQTNADEGDAPASDDDAKFWLGWNIEFE